MGSYERTKTHGSQYTGRDSISSTGNTKIHTISSQESSSVQVSLLTGHIDINSAADAGRLHFTDGDGGTKLDTYSIENTGYKEIPDYPINAVKTSNGNDLYMEVTGASGVEVVATVIVAEEM